MHKTDFMVKVSDEVRIQASLYASREKEKGSIACIITHPYSQWGGNMQNNVVIGVRNQLVKEGFPCVTFNFRGVGKSTGSMGDGTQEKEDLIGVCNYTRNILHLTQIIIIGYSYGALISLSAMKELGELICMCLISYPSGFVPHLSPEFDVGIPILFIHGEFDDVIPISRIKQLLPNFTHKTKFVSISTDHFYNGKENQVGAIITEFINNLKI
ncbi:MAG: alpha/beta fold hydrolase [Promethearchaeota archaeon]|nr:MAG: alpha/beta fold hydrolase [Candidatus Lokiarchaeota archaeon]